jgi:hypothetical protein
MKQIITTDPKKSNLCYHGKQPASTVFFTITKTKQPPFFSHFFGSDSLTTAVNEL